MGSPQGEALAGAVRTSVPLVLRFFDGFDDSNAIAQGPSLPNHAAWTLGHLALTMHRVAERYDDGPLPDSDFITADGTAGDAQRFDTESICYGSTPLADPAKYPGLARGREVFEAAAERLARAVESASDETLAAPQPWGSATLTGEQLIARIVFHNGTHAGQMTDLRRGLGMGRVIR